MLETKVYMFAVVPASMMLSWMFYFMEKISEALEDPFVGGPNDVPISTICRNIEIDLTEMLGDKAPPKIAPLNGVAL
jgi:ion channel-forming bestrophin family protein